MSTIGKAVAGVAVAGAFVAGLWLGGEDLNKTKNVIDEMVGIIYELKEDNDQLEQDGKEKEEKHKGIVGELQKANNELDKANKEAEQLRIYAEEKLQEVKTLTEGE
jgi:outer membrane murein-binding lipoprotein Lpp